jgi:hypothetical protein
MQTSRWGGIVVLGILLAGFVLVAGCPMMSGTWYAYSGSPTNGPVTITRTLQLNEDMTYTLVSKVCVHQYSDTFGTCTPQPDEVVEGTWKNLDNNMGKLNFPVYGGQSTTNSMNNYAIIQYQPRIPRLNINQGTLLLYRNQADWAKSTSPAGYPISLQE